MLHIADAVEGYRDGAAGYGLPLQNVEDADSSLWKHPEDGALPDPLERLALASGTPQHEQPLLLLRLYYILKNFNIHDVGFKLFMCNIYAYLGAAVPQ